MRPANNHTATAETATGTAELPTEPWQRILRDAVRDARELASILELPHALLARSIDHDPDFPLLVPRGFIARMRKGDPDDPLLAQVLPRIAERESVAGYGPDPLAERTFSSSGLVRKYAGRALLIATGACPVHCRYCFRRHFPYSSELAARNDWQPALAALAREPETFEVILSGGDPLTLSTRRLATVIAQLEQRPSLRYLRIHTRFPVMIPERVDDALIALLERSRLRTIVVIHVNHPNELDDEAVRSALQRLGASVHALLNQSVLLRGINDSPRVLIELSQALFDRGVLPYYIHLLDRVAGAAHFDVSEARAKSIVAEMRASLPGFLVPRLVREQAGELSKTLVA